MDRKNVHLVRKIEIGTGSNPANAAGPKTTGRDPVSDLVHETLNDAFVHAELGFRWDVWMDAGMVILST